MSDVEIARSGPEPGTEPGPGRRPRAEEWERGGVGRGRPADAYGEGTAAAIVVASVTGTSAPWISSSFFSSSSR